MEYLSKVGGSGRLLPPCGIIAGVTAPAIQTNQLTKHFEVPRSLKDLIRHPFSGAPESVTAVDGVSIQVHEGELFGLLGPNGAGKTTLIKMLCTLIEPSNGHATIAGTDLGQGSQVRALVGMAGGDERSFYWRLSGRQNLEFFAALYGLEPSPARRRVGELLAQVGLSAQADRPFRTYSSGQRQRLSIARALLHHPRVLFLDEPTRSLDPTATINLHEFIVQELLQREGMTILLTTHRLDEAQKLCQRIAIMDSGHIRACGTPDELRLGLSVAVNYRLQVSGLRIEPSDLAAGSPRTMRATVLEPDTWLIELESDDSGLFLAIMIDRITAAGGRIHDVSRDRPTLERVFERFTRS